MRMLSSEVTFTVMKTSILPRADVLFDRRLDRVLGEAEHARQLDVQIEIAVVDRPHFDRDLTAVDRFFRTAGTGQQLLIMSVPPTLFRFRVRRREIDGDGILTDRAGALVAVDAGRSQAPDRSLSVCRGAHAATIPDVVRGDLVCVRRVSADGDLHLLGKRSLP